MLTSAFQAPPREPRTPCADAEHALRGAAPSVEREAARVRAELDVPMPIDVEVPIGAPRRAGAAHPFERRVDRERVDFHSDGDGEVWAHGANYKMRFASGVARFDPFFASSAPRSYAVDFALRRVLLDARPLRFEVDAGAQRSATTVSFARGALVERYELAARTVEQSFVFADLPRRGELLLELDVASEIAPTRDADGFVFANEFGSVRYGNATAVDALGRKLALESTLQGGVLSIRVPAAFVAKAALPLVVDPVLAAFGIEASPASTSSPDVSFAVDGTSVLYCWEEEFNAADHDVWSDMYSASGSPLYSGDYIDMTAAYWARPRCANLGALDRFLVVAHVLNATTNRVEVWGRTRDAVQAVISPQFKIAGASSYDVLDPDVGGDPYPSGPSWFLVVYERVYAFGSDHDIHAKRVAGDGTVVSGTIGVDTSIYTYDSVPSVSKSDATTNWNIAWQRASPSGGNDIFAARVAWDGVPTSTSFAVAARALAHTNPSASSSKTGTESWLVAYEEDFGTDHDIIVSALDAHQVARSFNLSSFDGPFAYQDQVEPAIDCDGAHFACVYAEDYQTSTSDYDVYVSEILSNGSSLSVIEAHQGLFATNGTEYEAQIASVESSVVGANSHEYALAWHRAPDNYYFTSDDILGAAYRSHSGGQVASFCDGASIVCPCGNGASTVGGCPNSAHAGGALLSWSGDASTTNDTLQLFCGGMPAQVQCLFFQSASSINGIAGAPFGDGVRCAGAPMVRMGLKSSSNAGGALYPSGSDSTISLKGLIPPSGSTVVYQVWYRNPAAFCTSATPNMSNALVGAWTP